MNKRKKGGASIARSVVFIRRFAPDLALSHAPACAPLAPPRPAPDPPLHPSPPARSAASRKPTPAWASACSITGPRRPPSGQLYASRGASNSAKLLGEPLAWAFGLGHETVVEQRSQHTHYDRPQNVEPPAPYICGH